MDRQLSLKELLLASGTVVVPVVLAYVAQRDKAPRLDGVPFWAAFLCGAAWMLLAAVAWVFWFRPREERPAGTADHGRSLLLSLPASGFAGLILVASLTGELTLGTAAAVLLTGGLALALADRALGRIGEGEAVGLEGHWGGLGGGLGGWRLSPPAMLLLAALALAGTAAALVVRTPAQEKAPGSAAPPSAVAI